MAWFITATSIIIESGTTNLEKPDPGRDLNSRMGGRLPSEEQH